MKKILYSVITGILISVLTAFPVWLLVSLTMSAFGGRPYKFYEALALTAWCVVLTKCSTLTHKIGPGESENTEDPID